MNIDVKINRGQVAETINNYNESDLMACKNGDGLLSKADYDIIPYCNQCIARTQQAEISCRVRRNMRWIMGCAIAVALVIFTFATLIPLYQGGISYLFSQSKQAATILNVPLPLFSVLCVMCAAILLLWIRDRQIRRAVEMEFPLHR